MRVGVPREVKDGERRVGLVPAAVRTLVTQGHEVHVQRGAGERSGFADGEYRAAGAVLGEAAAAYACDLVVKVKELQPAEFPLLRAGSTLLGFAQLNRDRALLARVLAAGIRVIACETVRDGAGGLPLLAPMSRIAGRLAPIVGARALCTDHGGAGVLLTGLADVPAARVVIIGAGTAGSEAARIAARMGCRVSVFSRGATRLSALRATLAAEGHPVATHSLAEGSATLEATVVDADLVIGAVLEPGRLSPKLLSRALLRAMRRGAALVDIGIDQGGIAETSRMTSLSAPTYVEEGVVHYAVPNMPALVARTATLALGQATLPRVLALAAGVDQALRDDPGLAQGAQVWDGAVVHEGLARDSSEPCAPAPWQRAA